MTSSCMPLAGYAEDGQQFIMGGSLDLAHMFSSAPGPSYEFVQFVGTVMSIQPLTHSGIVNWNIGQFPRQGLN